MLFVHYVLHKLLRACIYKIILPARCAPDDIHASCVMYCSILAQVQLRPSLVWVSIPTSGGQSVSVEMCRRGQLPHSLGMVSCGGTVLPWYQECMIWRGE